MAGAYEENVSPISLNATVDYSGRVEGGAVGLYRFVVGDPTVENGFKRSGAAGLTLGVLTTKPPKGQPGRIANRGIVPIELGATLAAGAEVASGADGRAVAAGSNPSRGYLLGGGAAGTIVSVLLR